MCHWNIATVTAERPTQRLKENSSLSAPAGLSLSGPIQISRAIQKSYWRRSNRPLPVPLIAGSSSLSFCAFTPVSLCRFIGGAANAGPAATVSLSSSHTTSHHWFIQCSCAGLADCTCCANTFLSFFRFWFISLAWTDQWKSEEKGNLPGLIRGIVKENKIRRRLFLSWLNNEKTNKGKHSDSAVWL